MEVDDATVSPSISVAVRVRACIGACVCMHFYSACMARGSCFRLQLHGTAQKQIQDTGKGGIGIPGSVWGRSGGKVIFQILSHRF